MRRDSEEYGKYATGLRFMPYTVVDGIPTFKDSDLSRIYKRLVYEGIEPLLFHDGAINNEQDFISMIRNPNTLFWTITYEEKDVGFFWLNRLEKTHAYCHFTGYTEWWGRVITVVAGREAMRMLLTAKDTEGEYFWHTIMGMVPTSNVFAIDYLKRVGLETLGEVPNLIWSKEKSEPVPGTVMYITRELLEHADLH